MDYGAYINIEDKETQEVVKRNNIVVPRLRGYRLMKYETPVEEDSYQMSVFNQYCGREDVLMIHARIGGSNWEDYEEEVVNQPWFLEKVDDDFDPTYCDIYAKIK